MAVVYEEYSAEHDSLPPLVTHEQTGEEVKFDCICLGTGLKECVVSGLLSSSKRKVSLHGHCWVSIFNNDNNNKGFGVCPTDKEESRLSREFFRFRTLSCFVLLHSALTHVSLQVQKLSSLKCSMKYVTYTSITTGFECLGCQRHRKTLLTSFTKYESQQSCLQN